MKDESKHSIPVIIGPTASGKTAYGIELARACNGAVISADSRQVYAGMNIGTAKPEEAWQKTPHDLLTPNCIEGIDHYLLNISTPDTPISLAEWQSAAKKVIFHILASGMRPVIVGGTMLYVDSIVQNYNIPDAPENPLLREALREVPTEELYDRLIAQDPDASAFIEPHHKQRIIRALEVQEALKKPFSVTRTSRTAEHSYDLIGLFPRVKDEFPGEVGWNILRERIITRAQEMMTHGLVEEVRTLREQWGTHTRLLQTIQYKEIGLILDGRHSEETALEAIIQANMRYARRQMSWWKRTTGIRWVEP